MELLVMEVGMNRHMEEDEVERYSMRNMSEEESAPFDEHLLTCDVCRTRVEESEFYVQAMRSAASQIRHARAPQPWWRTGRIVRPVWAAALAGVAALVVVTTTDWVRSPAPQPVTLQAMRGTSPGAKVEPDRPLMLSPDLTGLPAFASYRVEIVDANGTPVFTADMTAPPVKAPRLRAGIYFARIYSPSGKLLREYGIEAAR